MNAIAEAIDSHVNKVYTLRQEPVSRREACGSDVRRQSARRHALRIEQHRQVAMPDFGIGRRAGLFLRVIGNAKASALDHRNIIWRHRLPPC